jgi:hypothetical protein
MSGRCLQCSDGLSRIDLNVMVQSTGFSRALPGKKNPAEAGTLNYYL